MTQWSCSVASGWASAGSASGPNSTAAVAEDTSDYRHWRCVEGPAAATAAAGRGTGVTRTVTVTLILVTTSMP